MGMCHIYVFGDLDRVIIRLNHFYIHMKYRLLYLLTGIFILASFVQCKNSVTGGSDENSEPGLEKFRLIAPELHSEQTTSLNFEWAEIEAASSFHIKMSTDKKFKHILVDSTIDSTSFSIQGLPHEAKIYWQVRPIVKSQKTSWSDIWDIKTVAEPGKPDPISTKLEMPEDGKKDLSLNVKLQWQVVANASKYKLQLAQDKNFKDSMVEENVKGTSYKASDLNSAKEYYWRVKPVIDGGKTTWSKIFSFMTTDSENTENPDANILPAPVQISPKQGEENVSLTPTFKWEAVDGADSYLLHVSVDNQMVIEKKVQATDFTSSNQLSAEKT